MHKTGIHNITYPLINQATFKPLLKYFKFPNLSWPRTNTGFLKSSEKALLCVYSMGFILTLVLVNCAVIPILLRARLALEPRTNKPGKGLNIIRHSSKMIVQLPSLKLASPRRNLDWSIFPQYSSGIFISWFSLRTFPTLSPQNPDANQRNSS